jgi:hypothetical protein
VTLPCAPYWIYTLIQDLEEMDAESDGNFCGAVILRVKARLGTLLQVPNLALYAAALDPNFGHLRFIDNALRIEVCCLMTVRCSP